MYASIAVACAIMVAIEESLNWVKIEQANIPGILRVETSFAILSIMFLTVLTSLFAYSYLKITKTLTKRNVNMSINKKMLTLNFTLISIIQLTWII